MFGFGVWVVGLSFVVGDDEAVVGAGFWVCVDWWVSVLGCWFGFGFAVLCFWVDWVLGFGGLGYVLFAVLGGGLS